MLQRHAMADPPPFAKAAEVCAQLAMGERALALLQGDPTPDAFLQDLVEQRMHVDAIRFLGLALPSRKSVWWGCTCVRETAGTLSPPENAALSAAVLWVLEPTTERVRAAKAVVHEVGIEAPAGVLALAVSKVATLPLATGKAVAGAVFMAAARGKGVSPRQLYRQFVALGLEVNRLPVPWERVPA